MILVRCVFLTLLAVDALCAQEVAHLKARTGKPVIQQLLGGCSLTCAFPWEALAGRSSSDGAVTALNDADSFTAWTNAQARDTLIFRFPSDLPRELDGTPLLWNRYRQWMSASGERFQGLWTRRDDWPFPQRQGALRNPLGGQPALATCHLSRRISKYRR
jgi:hypothetical protein